MFVIGLFFLFFTSQIFPVQAAETSPADFTGAETSLSDHQAVVYFIQGTAQILKKNTASWEALSVGTSINEGDQIRTSEASLAEVELDKFLKNTIRIEPNTLAEFASIEPTQIHLTDGTLLNMLEGLPSGSGFEVVSPTAVASVRGTIFVTSYQASVQTQKASVIQGQVELFVPKEPGSPDAKLPGWTVKRYESLQLDFRPEAMANLPKTPTHLITPEDLMDLKAQIEESHSHLEDFHGGAGAAEQAAAAWDEIRTDLHRLETIETGLQQGTSKLLAPKLKQSATLLEGTGQTSDEVQIDSRIVKTDEEQKEQDQLLGAKEAGLGSSDENQ